MINELTRKNAHTELDHIFKTILPAHGMTERPEQIRLSHTMLDAMFENRIALSDAGTGIGKTYAYLTAAIVYSHSRLVDGLPFQPVIIATSSIALQNAIVREYLPFLSDALSDDPHTQHRRSKTCSGCGASTYDYADHTYTYGRWTSSSDTQHKRTKTCSVCKATADEYADHTDANADGICDDCGANVALIVTWDAASNGGTVGGKNSVTTSVAPNQTAVAPGYTPVKVGHTFSGWYTEKTGGALYSTVTITAARTFYAQFTPAEYQITWDLGTGKTETTNQTYGETLNLPTEPTRRGYAFLGWFTQETGGTQVDGDTVFKEVASTTYYAHWEEATVFSVIVPAVLPVTVDQNGKVYVSNAEIVNHSTAAVQVSSVTLTAENGWTLVPYASDMSHAKVDSNQIGFKINSAQTSKTGSTEQFELTSPWQINEEESLTLTYDAVVSALSQPVTNANILCVLFVVEWA